MEEYSFSFTLYYSSLSFPTTLYSASGVITGYKISTSYHQSYYDNSGETVVGYQATSITGTINGVPIDGLSNYLNASNLVLPTNPQIFAKENSYIGQSGLSFIAGGVNYNIMPYFYDQYFFSSDSTKNLISRLPNAGFSVVCFCTGTRIATGRGEIAVESLRIGDEAVTASGIRRPIRWIGQREVNCAATAAGDDRPVRVRADAMAPGLPSNDVLVSPGHAIHVGEEGGVLIPAMALLNGATIAREPVSRTIYWHVELDSHDLLVSEGLATESYADCGNRDFFTTSMAAPDWIAPRDGDRYCLPLLSAGEQVGAIRDRLRQRAVDLGWSLCDDPLADHHLIVDGRRVDGDTVGLVTRFIVSAQAREISLEAKAGAPRDVGFGADERVLGVSVGSLTIDDGLLIRRAIDLDDPRLGGGFHAVETDRDGRRWRWTTGSTPLSRTLWEGCRGTFMLRIEMTQPSLPRLEPPLQETGEPCGVAGDRERLCDQTVFVAAA